jgi:polyphosphate kinase
LGNGKAEPQGCAADAAFKLAESPLPRATLSLLHVPPTQVAPRFVALPAPADQSAFMLLEDVLRVHLPVLYAGYEILSSHGVRVTRDAEVEIPRGRTEDLMVAIEAGLRERRMGDAVRLQYDPNLPLPVLTTLVSELELAPTDLSEEQGFAAFADLAQLYTAVDRPRLKERQLPPHPVAAFERAPDVWSAIRQGDILVHHPYHTFDVVTRFVQEAAADPAVPGAIGEYPTPHTVQMSNARRIIGGDTPRRSRGGHAYDVRIGEAVFERGGVKFGVIICADGGYSFGSSVGLVM